MAAFASALIAGLVGEAAKATVVPAVGMRKAAPAMKPARNTTFLGFMSPPLSRDRFAIAAAACSQSASDSTARDGCGKGPAQVIARARRAIQIPRPFRLLPRIKPQALALY